MHRTYTRTEAHTATYLQLGLVAVIWGGTFVAGRAMSPGTPPLLSASLRFLIAGGVLAVFLLLSGRGFARITRLQLLKISGLGLCGVYAYNLFFFYGLQHTTASRASLIVALNPAVIALTAYLFHQERLSRAKGLGIALCLLGAATVIFGKSPQALGAASHWLGDALVFGCVLSWVAYSVFGKNTVAQLGALHTVTYSLWAGAAMLTLTAVLTGQMGAASIAVLNGRDLACLLYLGALGSAVAYIWYYNGIQKIGVTRAGVFIALNPLTAVLLGALLLNEPLSATVLAGGALVVVGIGVCNLRPRGVAVA